MPDNPTSADAPAPRRTRRASTPTSSSTATPPRPRATRARRANAATPELPAKPHRQSFWEWIEAAGVELVGMQRLRFLLHRFGLKGVLVLALIGGYPLGQYSLISYAVNSSVPALAGDFGLQFEAEDWSYRPFSLTAIARNVTMRPKHDVQREGQPLFKAGQLEFKGSVFSLLRGVRELLTLNTFHTFNEITVKDAQLHLERSRTGALNWSEFEEGFPEDRLRELLSGLYQINAVILNNVRIEYVENLSGDSGGGVIQTAQAKVFVDGIQGAITEIGPALGGRMPTRIKIGARSSDGMIDIDGKLAFRADQGTGKPAVQSASLAGGAATPAGRSTGVGYDLVVDLSNIGAAAFVRTMPPTKVTATGGSVHGRLKVRSDAVPPCESALQMENVKYAPNPQLVRSRTEFDALQRLLQGRVVTREFKGCDATEKPTDTRPRSPGDGGPVRYASTVLAFTAAFNEQANADAPPEVRAVVAGDTYALTGRAAANAVLNDVTSHLTNELAGRIGGHTGTLLQGAAGTRPSAGKNVAPPSDDNAVTKGAKSIGNGIKRLFGGGKKPPPNSTTKGK